MYRIGHRWFRLAVLLALAICGVAHAAYPEQPITVIVPFIAGGGADVGTRIIAPYIEKYLPGAKFVILNKPGAGGDIGTLAIAQAKPDGYTIGLLNVPTTIMQLHERELQWSLASLTPIANLMADPTVLAVRTDSKYRTLADVVADAKARPGQISVSVSGAGTNTHLDVINLENAAKIKLLLAPFGGGGPSRLALLGGHVDIMSSALIDTQRFIEQGQLRGLAIGTKARYPLAPNIPTFIEQGVNVTGGATRGLVGPKGLPPEVVEKLSMAIEKALRDPEMIQKAAELALPLLYMSPVDYDAHLKLENRSLAETWKRMPWKE
jgi:tripartite-type tricarboxylate transporter receptor subunit TctC